MIDTKIVEDLVGKIERSIDSTVQVLVQSTIDNLVVDQTWLAKIETQLNQHMTSKLSGYLSKIDLNLLLRDQIDAGVDRWQDKLKKNFTTNGIMDVAETTQLTVVEGAVVVTNGLAVDKDLEVKGTAVINNLSVRGTINTDSRSWQELSDTIASKTIKKVVEEWQEKLITDVLKVASTSGINFDSININGNPLVENNTLTNQVTQSSLESVGTLKNLTVDGRTSLGQTVNINKGRVGINTENPEMALTVWDEEISLSAGKINKDTAFLGTTRKQKLVVGVNRGNQIEITDDGLVAVTQLRIDRWRISHAPEVPGWGGTKGDFVINNDPKVDKAFGWICLGGFQWHPLRGV